MGFIIQARQKGKIGISLNCNWYAPYTDSVADIDASKRAVDFMIGWFLSPLLTGKYPQTMIDNVQDNLPPFTDKESDMLKGSLDFLGLNYYTAMYAINDPKLPEDEPTYFKDMHLKTSCVDEKNNLDLTSLEACVDPVRIKYHQDHLAYLLKAMENLDNPVDVRGYFVWSYCDNYEWNEGYTVRFGITLVDYRDDCKRYPKDSAMWFCNFLSKKIEESKKRRIENSSEDHGAVKKLRATEE
ncbi:hypothetical protein BUALT_Bualt09G0058900 [Buddleja alternifolia]|uniref:Beta-glucosidase n=1 Tax=Buddleja alternifolia TaxID=168488 RepID=A0AAV6X0B3_9LAMI|nr:hypothetical protein BUALT_Bualt09G0058900 [Buddleja alternifolia]